MLDLGHLVNTMTDTFAEGHRAIALMMAAICVMAAASFDLIAGAMSENPLLFIAGVLFFCSGVLLFKLWKQNPRWLV
jgi:putative Ca2+/H+ antiporter (TMEM165/GDT1 family)